MHKYFLGCDWGTSSFRIRLFELSTKEVVVEASSEVGIASMNSRWQNLNTANKATKVQFFQEYLTTQIKILSGKNSLNLDNVSIVISGMASSSIGMIDVPYAKLPFALDGTDAITKYLPADNNFPHDIILISGVRSENDVMRGEETQLMGVVSLLANSPLTAAEAVLIFPGTHSKHIEIKGGKLTNFNTYMTGELFNLMSNHSILKDSVEKQDIAELSEADVDAFKLGVKKSKEKSVLNGLFTVRTNHLFNKLDKQQNGFYLSGLLIGEELHYFLRQEKPELFLCSGSNLFHFYKLAVEELGLSARTTFVSPEVVDKAAVEGQNLIFRKHIFTNKEVR